MDKDYRRADFRRINVRKDDFIDGLFIEYWAGDYPGLSGRWLARRLVITPWLRKLLKDQAERGEPDLLRSLGSRIQSLRRTTRGQIPQGGEEKFYREKDGARIFRHPIMSLN